MLLSHHLPKPKGYCDAGNAGSSKLSAWSSHHLPKPKGYCDRRAVAAISPGVLSCRTISQSRKAIATRLARGSRCFFPRRRTISQSRKAIATRAPSPPRWLFRRSHHLPKPKGYCDDLAGLEEGVAHEGRTISQSRKAIATPQLGDAKSPAGSGRTISQRRKAIATRPPARSMSRETRSHHLPKPKGYCDFPRR